MGWKTKLRHALELRGITPAEVARRLGIHRNTAANFFKPYEQKGSSVTPEVLWQLCQWAGVNADDVLDDSRPLRVEVDPPSSRTFARVSDHPAAAEAPRARTPRTTDQSRRRKAR